MDSVRVFYRVDSNMFVFTGHENWDNRTFFHYTKDGGQSWQGDGWLLGSQDWTHVAFYKDSIYETTNRSLHRAYSYTITDLPGYGNRFKKVFVDCGGILAITHEGKPALSIDGGKTWDSTSLPSPMEIGLPGCEGIDYLPTRMAAVGVTEPSEAYCVGSFDLILPSEVMIQYLSSAGQIIDVRSLGVLEPGHHLIPANSHALFYVLITNGDRRLGKLTRNVGY
jgi:hypothetical protein